MNIKQLNEQLSKLLEHWDYVGDDSIESKIDWLFTHNINLTKKQYYVIDDLRAFLKGEKDLTKEEIESLIYFLQHHNKNYRRGQEEIINDLKVSDFITSNKSETYAENKRKISFMLGDAKVEVTNSTDEKLTAEDIKNAIEKENPNIFWNDYGSYHYIMDFSFDKNGKKYWIESKNIENDFSKFELNVYE